MKHLWLRLMHREAIERLDDAKALRTVRANSRGSYLMQLIAFEILLKFVAYTTDPKNIQCRFRHDYRKIFDALSSPLQGRLLELAGNLVGPSGLSSRNDVFADWTANFDGLRYSFEKYKDYTAQDYQEKGDRWLADGARLDDATFRFHPEELRGMLHALGVVADEELQTLEDEALSRNSADQPTEVRPSDLYPLGAQLLARFGGRFCKVEPHENDDPNGSDLFWLTVKQDDVREGEVIALQPLSGDRWLVDHDVANKYGGWPTVWSVDGTQAEVLEAVTSHLGSPL